MITMATYEAYASQLAGSPVTISCEADATFLTSTSLGALGQPASLDGYVLNGPDGHFLRVIHLRQSECNALQRIDRKRVRYPSSYMSLLSTGERIDENDGRALGVLQHEATHILTDSRDEGLVECTAWQNRWQLVRLFKLPAWVTKILLTSITWHHLEMDAHYRTGC